jgi:hypothetical protein
MGRKRPQIWKGIEQLTVDHRRKSDATPPHIGIENKDAVLGKSKNHEMPEKVMIISTYRAINHKAKWPISDLPLAKSVVRH